MPFDPEAVRAFERAGWNRAAAGYEASFATATRQFIGPLLDAAAIGAGDDVLDLCCGPGFVAAAAVLRGSRVTGLDFSAAMLDQARTRFPALTFEQGDAEAPPFDAARFDAVVSNFGIHHVPRPRLALAGVHRILRHGGRFAFTIWAGQDENVAWRLVFDAIGRPGDPAASAAPAPGGGFAEADCLRALNDAGFVGIGTQLARAVWRHRDAAGLLAALRAGTARMAAMIEAQTAAAMPAILAALEQATSEWRDGTGIAVPIACVIASDPALTPRERGRGEGRRRIAGGLVVSAALHAVVLAALLLRLKWAPEPEMLPPPATVSMVFEGGGRKQPSSPEPTPIPGPDVTPPAPIGGPPPRATPPPATPAPTEAPAAAPPEPPPPLEPTPPSPPPAPPTPARPPPPPPAEATEPGPTEVIVPPPRPPEPPPAAPIPPARTQQTWPPMRQAGPARPESSFPAPMDFSLGRSEASSGAPAPGKPTLSLTLPRRGPEDATPYSLDTDAEVGPDWRNALSEWVEEHSYYPSQAAEMGQQGTARVLVTAMPDGRVTSVELEHGSGSPWLDLALEGMFRGAKLPPMPKSVGDQPVPFHFTMHYIIIR